MDDDALDRLFSGDLDKLVSLPKRVVRLFISSTFTDMMLERNSLMERVYPQLKKFCRERHGLDFQVVDMRWGVRDEATDDHQTATLCSREIDNCQRLSLGPNFVALLGDKYGFRPLCNRINSAEYRALRRCLIEVDISTDLLDTWYKEDLNSMPPEYLLQPISSILRNFTNRNEPELQASDQQAWMAIQDKLHKLLVIGSERLVQQGRMDKQEQLLKYSISVTEREVIEGCLDAANAKSCCLVYVRSIVDLREHLSKCLESLSENSHDQSETLIEGVESGSKPLKSPPPFASSAGEQGVNLMATRMQKNFKAALKRRAEKGRQMIGKYIDLTCGEPNQQPPCWQVDEEAQDLLAQLREVKLDLKFQSSGRSLTKYRLNWDEEEGLTLKRDDHKLYINEFTDHFYSNMTRMIKKAAGKNEQGLKSGLMGEVLQHSHYAKHASKSFHGRAEELEALRAYILGSHPTGVRPMFVYGVGGTGKTSVLAKAVCQAKSWILHAKSQKMGYLDERWDQQPCIIMRFCCATPSSSSLVGVLTSVCHQLQYNFYQFGPLNGAETNKDLMADDSDGDQQTQLFYEPVAEDFVRLVFTFRQLLENCQHRLHSKRLFVIVIDAVERLTAPADSNLEAKHSWLTGLTALPANVRLIVSCSSEITGGGLPMDYVHLKRHFLQVYLPVFGDGPSRKASDDTEGSSLRKESLPRLDSFCGSDISSRSELGGKRGRHSLARDSMTQGMLKRLVLPAVRMRRASDLFRLTDALVANQTANKSQAGAHDREPISSLGKRLSKTPSPTSAKNFVLRAPSLEQSKVATKNQTATNPMPRGVWMLHARPMGIDLACGLLKKWLREVGRTLTQQQWALVRKSFAHCSRPIFIKLAFGEIVNWKSYSVQSDSKGLTFGSTLLENLASEPPPGVTSKNADLEPYLAALMRHHHQMNVPEEQIKYQTIAIEQQWLTYLDYGQRKDEEALETDSSATDDFAGVRSRRSAQPLATTICHLSNSIDDAICQLFARIEMQHGFLLIKHSLSYITAARNGICENELEDILSLDDVVLDDVFQYHLPPVRRIPPLLWTRIRNDLPDYLSERDADGIVLNWHYSQFEEVTKRRYLNDTKQQIYIHSIMADYFIGKWAQVAKPFRCARRQLQMAAPSAAEVDKQEGSLQLNSVRSSGASGGSPTESSSRQANNATRFTSGGQPLPFSGRSSRIRSSDNSEARRLLWVQAKADRRVPQQPLHYDAVGGDASGSSDSRQSDGRQKRRRYNSRKLIELPHHLMHSKRFQDLANEVLFNYNWLYSALDALGLQSLLADFREASQNIEAAISCPNIEQIPSITTTDKHYKSKVVSQTDSTKELKSMRDQLQILANTIRLSSSSIHLEPQMLAPQLIGRLLPLVDSRGLANQKQGVQTPDSRGNIKHLLAQLLDQCDRDGSAHNSLLPTGHCLQAPDGLQLSSLEGHSFAIMGMSMTADGRHLLAVSNRFIMWDIATGEVSRDIDPKIGGSIMRQLKLSSNNEFALAFSSANQILILDILTHQVVKYSLDDDLMASPETIKGIELVDKSGASRFVVWTSDSWIVYRLIKNEDSFLTSGGSNHPQRVIIEREYSCSLSQLNLLDYLSLAIICVEICTVQSGLAFITVTESSKLDGRHKVKLLTVEECDSSAPKCWHYFEDYVACLALEPTRLRQLVFATLSGDLYLTRRRKFGWSDPKLLRKASSLMVANVGRSKQTLVEQLDALVDESGSISENKDNLAPIALELDCVFPSSHKDPPKSGGKQSEQQPSIEELERVVDAEQVMNDTKIDPKDREPPSARPVAASLIGRSSLPQINSSGNAQKQSCLTIKLYMSTRIVVMRLRGKSSPVFERNLVLPRDIRTISVEPNECQIKSVILDSSNSLSSSLLVATVGRRLLIYSLDSEQFLKQLEAHSGRIVQLLPICLPSSDSNNNETANNKATDRLSDNSDESWATNLCVASASMDKTVKVWNLANLNKEVHMLDKLDQSLEYISLASGQYPLAACLSRSELGLWDWRTLKLLWRLEASGLQRVPQYVAPGKVSAGPGLISGGGSRILKCRLSSNGHYLCLLSQTTLHLLSSTSGPSSRADWASHRHQNHHHARATTRASLDNFSASYNLQSFAHQLPSGATPLDTRFFHQESRLLTTLALPSTHSKADDALVSSEQAAQTHLLVWCHSIPDGQLLYKIMLVSPLVQTSADSRSLNIQQQQQQQPAQQPSGTQRRRSLVPTNSGNSLSGQGTGNKKMMASNESNSIATTRLKPVLTRDQVHVVALTVTEQTRAEDDHHQRHHQQTQARRQSGPLPVCLSVYSARDGLLLRSIDLTHLETQPSRSSSSSSSSFASSSLSQVASAANHGGHQINNKSATSTSPHHNQPAAAATKLLATATEATTKLIQQQQQTAFVSVVSDQFTRLKAVYYRERQTVVALLDEDSGCSHLIDVHSRQLLASSTIWNGQMSRDGRYGLSRMFKPGGVQAADNSAGLSSSVLLDGLQLLEMNRLSPIKSLLTYDTLGRLLNSAPASAFSGVGKSSSKTNKSSPATTAATTGSQADITCGFAGLDDAYVYYYDSRLSRLLLLRVRDAQLVANYKLSSRASKIKASPDGGQALVLGLADGSLTSLAIVDPQNSDTLAHLAQYPSRRRL